MQKERVRILGIDIDNIDIRPKTVKKLIKNDTYANVTHNINYDWA